MRAETRRGAAPPAGVVDVWCVPLDSPELPRELLLAALDEAERERLVRVRVPDEPRAAAHGALRIILAGCLGVPPAALRFEQEAGGKPRLAGGQGLEFSLSHSKGLALVAVACDREVGIDVERENDRTDIEEVTREFLSPADGASIESAVPEERRARFFAAWTRHEAQLKLRGQGLEVRAGGPGLEPGALVVTRMLSARPGYAAAVAAEGSGWTVRMRELTADTLRRME